MTEPVQRRALKNASVGVLAFALSSIASVVSVPICLRAWGSDRYGAWLTLIAAFTVLRTLDNGYVNYVGNQLNVLYHQNHPRLITSLASAFPVCLMLGVLQLFVWGALAATGFTDELFGMSTSEIARHDLIPALGVLIVAWMVTGPFLGIVHRLLIPSGLLYQASWWAIGYQMVQVLALVASALLNASLLQAAFFYAAVQSTIYVASAAYVCFKVPEFYPWWRGGSARTGLVDLSRSFLLTLGGIGQQATISGTMLLVSSSIGAASVPIFSTIRTLSNLWTSLALVFSAPLLPDVVRYHGAREVGKLLRAFQAQWFFGGLIVNGSMIVAMPLVDAVYRIWTDGLPFDQRLFLLMMAAVSLATFGSVLNSYLAGVNNLGSQTVITLARAAALFTISFMLVPDHGMVAIGAASWLAECLCSVILSVFFAARQIAGLGGRLRLSDVAFGLLGVAPLQLVAFMTLQSGSVSIGSCVLACLLHCWLSAVGWRRLGPEVRERALDILRR